MINCDDNNDDGAMEKPLSKKAITNENKSESSRIEEFKIDNFKLVSIGIVESIFNRKNGTPRQSGICPQSKGIIRIWKRLFNNPSHTLIGIEKFSYLWILFYFHENHNKRRFLAKIHPPRLDGQSCGIFATRSPHRPNPIGLSIVKLDRIEDGCLHVSGLDMIDKTPVIDIKPYIAKYDSPFTDLIISSSHEDENNHYNEKQSDDEISQENPINDMEKKSNTKSTDWIDGSLVDEINVEFTERSLEQLKQFHSFQLYHNDKPSSNKQCNYCFRLFSNENEAKNAIENLLKADPRSVYRRQKCIDRLYYFTIDSIHITAWFDLDTNMVEVLKIKPWTLAKNSLK